MVPGIAKLESIGKKYTSVLAGFIGNVMEWYDFALYGYMASIISQQFFPSSHNTASLLATYGVFAAGFIMRPLGSALFGWFGDTFGRSKTMLISVSMMSLPTFLLGCLPTFDTVGILAPILLVLIRLVQGLSVGGEFSSSVTYLVETAPTGKRGFTGSWANTGSIFGMLLGSGIAALLTTTLSSEVITSWGWRIPFLFGGVLGTIAIILRKDLPKSKHFEKHHKQRSETSPLLAAFTTNRKEMIQAILFASAYGVLFYIPLVYLPTWLHEELNFQLDSAMRINTAATAFLMILIPFAGKLSDHLIRRTHFISLAMLISAVISWPAYYFLPSAGFAGVVLLQFIFIVIVAVPLGSAPAMFVELFPSCDRLSGYSVAYNLGLGVVGGSAPMISTWLIEVTSLSTAPAIFLAFVSLVAFAVSLWIKDGSREPLK
ncbi:MFS transporter [Flexistipes sp.]|uniref:MFS transporter n=1 Tax=Flexistipes sp. TaxID=3088135 RepID=UPI002E200420|nr:MFS transporter [Flexistipes sp.]